MIRQALFDLAKLKQNHGSESLVHKIAFLHVAYFVNRSQFFWFGQLSCHSPGILVSLEHEVHVADEDGCTVSLCCEMCALMECNNADASFVWIGESV